MSIQKFCTTHDMKIFNELPLNIRNTFLEVSKFIINKHNKMVKEKSTSFIGLRGLAYIIINNMTKPSYFHPKEIYGINDIYILESKEYNMKVLSLGDSHTNEYKCNGKPKDTMSVIDFITNEIITSDSYIDLYLEIAYLSKAQKTGPKLRDNSYLRLMHDRFIDCFEWSKTMCKYPHLRAHYIDLRITVGDDTFVNFEGYIVMMYYRGRQSYPKETDLYMRSKKLESIFSTKESLIKYISDTILGSKIQKQIDNISQRSMRIRISKQIQLWVNEPNFYHHFKGYNYNIKWEHLKWSYIKEAMKTLDKTMISNVYDSLVRYTAVIMDSYALARMFRDYTPIPNKNSAKAKNIILYNGGFHNYRYIDFMVGILGFKITSQQYDNHSCVDVSNINLPIFSSSDSSTANLKSCPPCITTKICNPKTGNCVLRNGKVGREIIEKL